DLTKATAAVDMTSAGLVGFAAPDLTFPNMWSFLTPAGNFVQATGAGMTFDASGRAQSGAVNTISIDIGTNSFADPDISITDVSVDAPILDDGTANFWRILEGNDVIIGSSALKVPSSAESVLFGDSHAALAGSAGDDFIL